MAAEIKRQPVSGKVGASKPNAQANAGVELDVALRKAIGASISVATSSNQTLDGTLFTADPVTKLVAINTAPGSANSGSFHVIPISHIQSFRISSTAPPTSTFADVQPPIARLDIRALQGREEAAIKKQKEYDASRGKGVSKEGQDLFDALSRTLPTRWHETSIVVSDAVMIRAPYRSEDCSAPQNQQKALQRVKQVLEAERAKIVQRSKASASQGVRKGG